MMPAAPRSPSRISLWLAGLQAGMVAALWMLAWLGTSAAWQRRSFWTTANLMATTFYGGNALRDGFSFRTVSGVALLLLVYSSLGCLFAAVSGSKAAPSRLLVGGIVFALAWYYVSFHVFWRVLSPLVPLLHAVRPTVVGHVLYGVLLARFPHDLPKTVSEAPVPAAAGVSEEGHNVSG